MSSVPITDADGAARKVDTITRTDGGATVETQAVAVINPGSGSPIDFATQTTVAALLAAAQAIQTAAEALNTKTTAVNTGAIAGTVALDAPTLAALEQITAVGPLTNTELRAAPVSVAARTSDGAGNAITSIADGAGQTGLAIAFAATNFVLSSNNSTTTQLNSGATFTGVLESIFNQQAVSVLLTSDQPGTLILNQYIDAAGLRKISAWSFAIAAGVPFSRNFVGNGNYFNLTFQNTGASATTTLNINTAYGTLAAATNLGNAPLALNEVNGAIFQLGQAAMAASLPVTLASDQPTLAVNQSGVSATGSISALNANLATGVATANSAVALGLTGATGFTVDLRGTFVATIVIQGTVNGTDWITLSTLPIGAGLNVAQVASMTAVGAWNGNANGMQQIRATASAYTSGTVTVTLRAMQAAGMVFNLPAGQTTQPVSGTVGVTGYPTAAASADALANPTVTQLGALGLAFNATSWDRVRNNVNAVTGDTGAKTTSFAGATQTNFNAAGVAILINMGAVTGTSPTLTAQLQISPDGGTTWKDVPGAVTPTINASGTTLLTVYPGVTPVANAAVSHPLPRTWRLNYVIGGTTPSFTITNVQAAYIN